MSSDEAEKIARRWMGKLPRDDFDNLLLLTRQAYADGYDDAIRIAASICAAIEAEAYGNSAEQAGAHQCAQRIRALLSAEPPATGADQ